jgi:hypothetical protein
MWAPGFAVSVTREQVRSFRTPMLVLPGVDEYHPAETGREVAALAPAAELLEPWKDPGHLPAATKAVGRFLRDHPRARSPASCDRRSSARAACAAELATRNAGNQPGKSTVRGHLPVASRDRQQPGSSAPEPRCGPGLRSCGAEDTQLNQPAHSPTSGSGTL